MAKDIMQSNPTVAFGQTSEMMPFIHDYLSENGMDDVDWDNNKLDEKTALALVTVNNNTNTEDFVEGGGTNADSSRYKVGEKVIIMGGASYYSSKNAESPAGKIELTTYGVLDYNGYLENSPPLNPLKVSLMRSPLETKKQSMISFSDEITSSVNTNQKQSGGTTQSSSVYLRKQDVIPSYSDIVVSSATKTVATVGKIESKGISFVNQVTRLGAFAKEFNPDPEQYLNDYFEKNSAVYRLAKQKESEERLLRLKKQSSLKTQSKNMCFNNTGMFIKNLITDTVIYIPFNPSDLDESYSVSWQEANTRGSSHSVYGYEMTTGASPSISFDLDVGALTSYISKQMNKGAPDFENSFLDENLILSNKDKNYKKTQFNVSDNKMLMSEVFDIVTDYLNALKALAYPKYTNGLVTPPSCYISIANNFRFVGVCTGVTITHSPPILINCYNIKKGMSVDRSTDPNLSGQQIFMKYSITLGFNKIVNQDFSADTVEVYGDLWTGGQSNLD